jgi:hypothetical protein
MGGAVTAGLVLFLSACSSFQGGRPLDQLPLPVPADKRVEVWSKGERYQLHALTVDADSLRGVRWWNDPQCDSCRVTLARTSVDSVRTLGHDGGKTGALILIVTPIATFGFLWFLLASTGSEL